MASAFSTPTFATAAVDAMSSCFSATPPTRPSSPCVIAATAEAVALFIVASILRGRSPET